MTHIYDITRPTNYNMHRQYINDQYRTSSEIEYINTISGIYIYNDLSVNLTSVSIRS